MAHLSQDNSKILKRVRRLKGQLQGLERMLEHGEDCYAILQNAAACRGALNGLMRELILEHIEHHVAQAPEASGAIRKTAEELQDIVKSYLK